MTSRRPQELVFTLFGDFLLHRPGPVWVGSLIDLLGTLGLSPGNVRTVLSRMVAKGWLTTAREGRRSYYELAERGRSLLEEGAARIYHPPRDAPWHGEWTLVSYSIPEEQRHLRDRLRVRLSWLGFGSLGNGLWVSPHDVRDRVLDVARDLGVTDHLEVFRGTHLGPSEPERLVARCWDLDAINRRYEAFVDRHLDPYRRLKAAGADSVPGRECFTRRFELVHEFREFPLLDPFLPRALHPEDWGGECAMALFQVYHELLREAADRHLDSVLETPENAVFPAAP